MSRNKVSLPTLDVTKSGTTIKTINTNKTRNISDYRNIHIGINNFNSKLNQIKMEKVLRNKAKKLKPLVFEYKTLNKNLSIFTDDILIFKNSEIFSSLNNINILSEVKNETLLKNLDNTLPIINIHTKNVKDNKEVTKIEQTIQVDKTVQAKDIIKNEINNQSNQDENYVIVEAQKENFNSNSPNKNKPNNMKGKPNHYRNYSSLIQLLGLTTSSILKDEKRSKSFLNDKMKKSNKFKNDLIKKNQLTHFLEAKQKNNIPLVFPVALVNGMNFQSLSQLNRFEKIKQSLLNLKYLIDQDEENEIKIVKEFFLKNNLLIEEIFSLEFINKFLRFLKTDFTLSSNSTLKQIIDKIFREKEEKIKKDFNKINKDFVRTKSHTNKPINYNSYFDRFQMKEYLGQLEKFDKRHKIDTENPKELIKELEDELNKSIYKISHINGKIDKEEVKDTNDIEKVKKNNKLLELVILQRTKNKYLIQKSN